MLDVPVSPNNESLVPDPGEMQDPCEENFTLTVQKIWNDDNNRDGLRPASVRVRLIRHWYLPDGTPVTENGEPKTDIYTDSTVIPDIDANAWFELTKADHERPGSATWTRRIEGLPSLKYQTDPDTGEILRDPETGLKLVEHYYSYTAEEEPVPGYTVSYTYYDNGLTVRIINTHRNTLPVTGGEGDLYFVVGGVGLILTALLAFRRKKTAGQKGSRIFRPPRGSP